MEIFRKRLMFGLRFKLTLLIESIIVLLVIVTGIITTLREKVTLEDELRKRGLSLASDLAKFTARPMLSFDLPTLRRFVNHSMEQDYVRYVMLLDPNNRVVMHSNLAEVGKIYQGNADDHRPQRTHPPAHLFTHLPEPSELHYDLSAPIEVAGTKLGTVRLGYSYSAVEKEISKAREQIFILGVLTIVIGGIAAYFLATLISTPIKRIIEATEIVANGNLNPSLAIERTDEIGVLAHSFNKMAEELEKHRRQLQNLVEDRTVELETANIQLKQEISERERTQDELGQSRERLRKLALHLQYVREEEAKRIAREIHDELGQALTALKFDLHWLARKLPPDQLPLHGKIQTMSNLINMTVQTVRRISSELRPGLLDDFGLSAAMEWQTKEFAERTGISCDFVSNPENIVLDQNRSIAVFRIFQETLTNIARHANATEIEAILKETESDVNLEVRDNGKGITEKQLSDSRSFGVIGMHERVNSFGGELRINGTEDKGTTVAVRIPKGEI
jgi:signal transduction histidine kinase